MNQRGFVPIIFIAVISILSLSIIGGAWYYSTLSNSQDLNSVQNPVQIEINNQTDSWKVFTDKNNFFSIKYPGDMFVYNSCPEFKSEFVLVKRLPADSEEISDCKREPLFEINPDMVFKMFTNKPLKIEETNLDTLKMKKYIYSNGMLVSTVDSWKINFAYYDVESIQMFDQMLSTFKFLDHRLTRDVKRVTDLAILQNAINVAVQESTLNPEKPNILCKGLHIPSNCYGSSLLAGLQTNGDGWVKTDLTQQTRVPIKELSIDPKNNQTFHYAYCASADNWEINTVLESPLYQNRMKDDGGDDDNKYEIGSNLTLMNKLPECKY